MDIDQVPIGTGFGPATTAADVLQGIDLNGKRAVVTGGYSGIGLATVQALAAVGAEVLVPARRPGVAAEALAGTSRVTVGAMDLADQASVASYAASVVETGGAVDIVIDNAGVMATPETRVGPGWEMQLATNHLGHFALVLGLWPALVRAGGARVVSVSSLGHHQSAMRWDDPHFERGGYDKWLAYGQSKTANILFALHLAELGAPYGVSANSLHPGAILTDLGRHMTEDDLDKVMVRDADGNVALPEFKEPAQGAATSLFAATSPQLEGRSGAYLEDCDIAGFADADGPLATGVKRYALDPGEAVRLWDWSLAETSLEFVE